jgi:flavorubredoxin
MVKVLVVYTTRNGKTKTIAEFIAEGLRATGVEVKITDANDVANESDIAGYDVYVFGSPTYHGAMMQPMKRMLSIAEKAHLEGKMGAAFGSYGWSGEAPDRIYDAMENICHMDMASNALKIQSPIAAERLQQISRAYGSEIGKKATT